MARRWCKATMPNNSSTNKALVHVKTWEIDGWWLPSNLKYNDIKELYLLWYALSFLNKMRWYCMATTIIGLKIEYCLVWNHRRIWIIYDKTHGTCMKWMIPYHTLPQKVMLVLHQGKSAFGSLLVSVFVMVQNTFQYCEREVCFYKKR